jgi:nicotinamidase-related amidase
MAAAARSAAGRLVQSQTQFFVCDVQEKFRTKISYMPAVIEVARRLVSEPCAAFCLLMGFPFQTAASKILGIPTIVTEQYPQALGATVPEVSVAHASVFPKTRFSMVVPSVEAAMAATPERTTVVLFGIEAHVCVQQTALELRDRGYAVHVVADGTSSRSPTDRAVAFEVGWCGCAGNVI